MNDQKLKFRQGKNLERMAKIFGRRLTDIGGQSKFLFFFFIFGIRSFSNLYSVRPGLWNKRFLKNKIVAQAN